MKKKGFKGMTLVEIIVAMAVLAIASSVMVTACIGVSNMKVSTNALNKRISYQSPIADNQSIGSANAIDSSKESLSYKRPDGTTVTEDKNFIIISNGASSYKAVGELYSVKNQIQYDGKPDVANYGTGVVDVSGNNFKFFKVTTTYEMTQRTN